MKKKITDGRWIKIWYLDDKYVFKIYPRNNKQQEIGSSSEFSTCEECEQAIKAFIHHILRKPVKDKNSKYIKFEQYKDEKSLWHYRYVCIDEIGTPIFYQRYVGRKVNSQKGVSSLFSTLENAYGGIS